MKIHIEDRTLATTRQGISVVIPAYNEEQGIEPTLTSLHRQIEGTGLPYEVVVVDDGSTDGTAERAESAGGKVHVIRQRMNRGYGAALKAGIRHARYPIVCIADADGTYPLDRIPELVERLLSGSAHMVVGARIGEEARIPLARRPAKWALRRLAEIVSGERIPDLNSGLRVFRRDVALGFFSLLPDGFSFTTTITLAMLSNGYLVEYVPIAYGQRVGRSKIRPVRDSLNFVSLVLRIALYFAPLKIFLPLSGLLFTLAVAWGVLSKLVLGKLADISTVVIVMAAVQVAVVGLLAELVNHRLPNTFREQE